MIPCKYFRTRIGCARGTHCRYAHEESASASPFNVPTFPKPAGDRGNSNITPTSPHKDSLSKVPCVFFLRGYCRNGSACSFSHQSDQSHALSRPDTDSNYKEPTTEHCTRELCGASVTFDDGAQVSKVSFPSDFSAVRIDGLPLNSNPGFVTTTLSGLGFELPDTCVRILAHGGSTDKLSAIVQMEDPSFAANLREELERRKSRDAKYIQLEAVHIPPSVLSESAARRVDSRRVICSWRKPSRRAKIKFGNESIAKRVMGKFQDGRYKILGDKVDCDLVTRFAGRANSVNLTTVWTVVLKNLPGVTTENDIARAIQSYDRPRDIELDNPTYSITDNQACSTIKSMFLSVGPLDLWEASADWDAQRMKAKARFQNDTDAREAAKRLNRETLPFYKFGRLSVDLITRAKFKVSTNIYDAVQPVIEQENSTWSGERIKLHTYRNVDATQKYTVLTLGGPAANEVAKAKDKLANILTGHIAVDADDDTPIWGGFFNSRKAHNDLKFVENDFGVVIVIDKRKSRLRLYGSAQNCKDATIRLREIANADFSIRYIVLDVFKYWWAAHGGFQRIVAAVGEGVAAMDTISTPKRIIISGSAQDFETASAICQGQIRQSEKAKVEAGKSDDCTVCWTEAENPIRTQCEHLYCLDCFENLCWSAASGNKEAAISCQGDEGRCNAIFSLRELQEHLPSSSFEEILEASLTSHVRRRPQDFRYCPTADCGEIYRNCAEVNNTVRICGKCCLATCTSCHAPHEGMTCGEYKDIASGGHEAFERLKEKGGWKDCPKCGTTIEKTDGCNHMTCPGCRIHICWVCLETFQADGPCYEHMNRRHGNIGLFIPLDDL
ncbi:hypothetical protein BDY21DRAFT_316292 [Lineolata rhizophorae]|uniref:Uncharacterized protein n=1 Tax=Lineolata rhizophorae TaxID=578093 RepID=A0A6A6P6W4_9PEZI|nr:hypothetical protein BDY21DRAFT_316292 [Lineolata rhizophorae]